MIMELRHLRYFITVAEELHFARAADRLHIVQPALSMQIKALETELGTALLLRDRRKVALTEAGRLFLVEARATLAQAQKAAAVARQAAAGDIGRVQLGYSASAIYSGILAEAVRRFSASHPNVDLQALEVHPQGQYDALANGEIDVAFGSTLSLPGSDAFYTRRLASFPLKIALPRDHRLAGLDVIDPALLREDGFIGYAGSQDADGVKLIRHVMKFEPVMRCRASNPLMALGLVDAGLGVMIIPALLARSFDTGIHYRSLAGVSDEIDVTLIWRRNEAAPAVRAMIDSVAPAA
jgi:DNA-binding transcriptional LysR family regulator